LPGARGAAGRTTAFRLAERPDRHSFMAV